MATPGRLDIGSIQWEQTPEERKRQLDIETSAAGLPYVGKKGEIDVATGEETLKQKGFERVDKMRSDFEGNPDYKRYAVTIPALEAALTTTDDAMGDIALTYYAAKLFDPDSAVREGEQETMKTAEAALARMAEKLKKEFGFNGATFTDAGRNRLRQQLIRRAATMNKSYNRVRDQYTKLAERRQYDPADVVGDHVGAPFVDTMRAYDERRRQAGAKVAPVGAAATAIAGGERPTADVFQGVPEGTQIAGEPVRGWRYSPEREQSIVDYMRDPNSTPEGVAALTADSAVAEGHVRPEDRDAYFLRNLEDYGEYYKNVSPAQRAHIKNLDYTEVDKAATESAGLGASVAQAARNIPESAAQMASGLVTMPFTAYDVATSGRAGDVASEVVDVMKERLANPKRTAITDPLGFLGDVSIPLTLGGSTMAAAGGKLGTVGSAIAKAGKIIDPLSAVAGLTTEAVPAVVSAGTRKVPGATQLAADFPSEVAGLPSGVGGPALREATGAGFERGVTGAPTPRSTALTEGMRSPEMSGDKVVTAARDAVGQIREQASAAYTKAMQQFGQAPKPLPIANVIQRLQRIKPRNFDAMLNSPNRPSDHLAWEQMMNTVQHYATEAARDMSLLEPLAMDAFKQDLYSVGSKIGGAYDRDAARIASTAYNAVKDELVKHDSVYADTMKNYEKAATEARQIEDTFGLAAARGKPVNTDKALRRLQSIYRNNAYTNYGQRAAQGERLAAMDTSGTVMPTLAGQQLSSWAPRGLQRGTAPLAILGTGFANLPAAVGLALASSPRIAGEIAYGAGRVAGTGTRAAKGAYDLYEKYPTAALGATAAGSRLEEANMEDLRQRYGLEEPSALSWTPEGGTDGPQA